VTWTIHGFKVWPNILNFIGRVSFLIFEPTWMVHNNMYRSKILYLTNIRGYLSVTKIDSFFINFSKTANIVCLFLFGTNVKNKFLKLFLSTPPIIHCTPSTLSSVWWTYSFFFAYCVLPIALQYCHLQFSHFGCYSFNCFQNFFFFYF
jgi:hypothetical protein